MEFYHTLGFDHVPNSNPSLLIGGNAIIEINPSRYARPGIKIYLGEPLKTTKKLKEITPVYEMENGYVLSDMSGCWVYLCEDSFDFEKAVLDKPTVVPGNFMGVSLESAFFEKSVAIWSLLGFDIQSGSLDESYVVLSDADGFTVSIMKPQTCPHLFFNPSLTYFNGEANVEVIESIRALGIPITEEITHFNEQGIVDNIIIRDPGGYGFFIFND